MVFLSFSVVASDNPLLKAIQHTDSAIRAPTGKTIAEHAEIALTHANTARNDKEHKINNKHLDEGIKCLDDAINEDRNGNVDAARQAAADALDYFIQAEK